MRSFKRSQRVADQIKRDASEVIEEMLRDRSEMMVTVSGVDVSTDLRYARIFYTVLGGDEMAERARRFFERSTGFIQSTLAKRLRIRRMPEISMHYDSSLIEGMRMVNLIDDVMSKTDEEHERED